MSHDSSQNHERVAVIGAGMAGLTCARALVAAGVSVTLFDKARGPGGRMASRRRDGRVFDHGAQFFTIRDPRFAAACADWERRGWIARWRPRIAEIAEDGARARVEDERARMVGAPRMSGLTRALAAGLELQAGVRVGGLERRADGWALAAEGRFLGAFSAVVVTTPAPQAAPLLASSPALRGRVEAVTLDPCVAAMVEFPQPLAVDVDVLRARAQTSWAFAWAARDSSKPEREAGERWVIHSSPRWAADNLERDPGESAAALVDELGRALGGVPTPTLLLGHRWRYAQVRAGLGEACLYDASLRLGACGDWCVGPRVEAAFCSGDAMARRLLATRR